MECDTDVSVETQPSSVSFLDLDIPRPLQIIKRADGIGGLYSQDRDASWPSSASSEPEPCLGSPPEPHGGDLPLVVPKKRAVVRNILETAAFRDISSDSGYAPDVSTPDCLDLDVEVDDTTPKPQRSTSDVSPIRAPVFFAPPTLTSKASMLCLRGRRFPSRSMYNVDPGLQPSRPQVDNLYEPTRDVTSPDPFSRYVVTPPTSRISSSNFDISETNTSTTSSSPYLLALRAAVEICTQLVHAGGTESNKSCVLEGTTAHTGIFKYGCLYDVKAKISGTASSSLVEVLEDKSASTTLYPGSKLLILAHVRLAKNATPLCHARQNSDDLIEVLEFTLGTRMTEYLSVRLTYRHSAFPEQTNGTDRMQTSLTSIATAAVKRHSPSSLWSPRRTQPKQAPKQPNPLFEIIAAHWGTEAAVDLSRRILFPPLKQARLLKPAKSAYIARKTVPPPMIPRRKGSLRRGLRYTAPDLGAEDDEEENERQNDRARKIWSQIRRMSSVGGDGESEDERTVSSGSVRVSTVGVGDIGNYNGGERKRDRMVGDGEAQGRRAVRDDRPDRLTPTVADRKENNPPRCSGAGEKGFEKEMGMRLGAASNSLNGSRSGRNEQVKENARWGWSSWWQ